MSTARHRSFGAQARHFFDRDHESIPPVPLGGDAAWTGAGLRDRQGDWLDVLDPSEVAELAAAAERIEAQGLALADVDRSNFELPTLAARIEGWRATLALGRGFVVVRGLPVAEWGPERSALVYWGLGHHLGVPGAQNPQDELLGHVVDYGEEGRDPLVRRYRTAGNIDFHCDAADVVGLLCLQPAVTGGQSRIASSVTVFERFAAEAPELVPRLFEPFALDSRGEERPGARRWAPINPCRWSAARGLRTFWHSEYYRSAERHDDVTFDDATRRTLDLYDALCAEPDIHLDMWLEAGDMQFISNHTTIHARTAYEDRPEQRRHLLRLWLSLTD